MSIEDRGRLGRIGFATVMTGLMMGTLSSIADASAIRPNPQQKPVYYSTSGTLGGTTDALEFVGVSTPSTAPGGVFYMPGAFSLGGFKATGLPAGESRTFDAMPFSITLNLFNDPFTGPVVSQIKIDGVLDGELSSEPGKGLLAMVTSITQMGTPVGRPPFRIEDLDILAPQFILPAGPLPSVTTPIYGYVDAQVPEPTALATLGLGVVAFGARSWLRRRRSAAALTRIPS